MRRGYTIARRPQLPIAVETSQGTVRLIGIDTPERGACGSGAATRHAEDIAPAGSQVLLGNR